MLRPFYQACWATLTFAAIAVGDQMLDVAFSYEPCAKNPDIASLDQLRGVYHGNITFGTQYASDGGSDYPGDWLAFKCIYSNTQLSSTQYIDTFTEAWDDKNPKCGADVVQTINRNTQGWSLGKGSNWCIDLTTPTDGPNVGKLAYCAEWRYGQEIGNSTKRWEHGREVREFSA